MKPPRPLLSSSPFLLLLLLFTLAACTPDPNAEFIQGTWEFVNETGEERSGAAHVYQVWQFRGGSFYFEQEIFFGFPQYAEGHYRMLESIEGEVVIELYDVSGTQPLGNPAELTILIDEANDTLRIQRVLYVRAGP
jgi:hypothetical protein